MIEMDWHVVAIMYPEAIQAWVQKFGPLPDGPVTEADWNAVREGRALTDTAEPDD